MQETWRQIEDLVGYEVSNHGRVRSWWTTAGGSRTWRDEPRLLKATPGSESSPYLRVTLCVLGTKYTRRLHNLVLVAFVGPKPIGKWGLHNDGDLLNNREENLRWGTPTENADDRSLHGRTMRGPRNHKAKLTPRQVHTILAAYRSRRATQIQLSREFGVSQASISSIVRGTTWAHLPRQPAGV